jgi:hypothetical protein
MLEDPDHHDKNEEHDDAGEEVTGNDRCAALPTRAYMRGFIDVLRIGKR